MSYVLDGTPEAADPDRAAGAGTDCSCSSGASASRSRSSTSPSEPAAVHWHGIELESYPDGVPGWSGSGKTILPSIAPGDSLTVRWTPPRAGSFMYHTHFNEAMQMGSGLVRADHRAGARGSASIRRRTRSCSSARRAPPTNPVFGPFPNFVMNGKTQPEAMNLKAGTRYRFRLFNLAGDSPLQVSLNAGDAPIDWRAVAKDGYPLPPSQSGSARRGARVRSRGDLRFRVHAGHRGGADAQVRAGASTARPPQAARPAASSRPASAGSPPRPRRRPR